MKKKKLLSTIVSTLLVGSMALTGCGKDDDKKDDKTTTSAPTTEATQGTSGDDTTEATTSGGSGYDECTITFDWWGGDSRHEATQAAVDAFMKKYPGIKVEVNFGAWSDWETAKAAEYISGNNPDVQQTNFDWIGKYDADGTTYLDLNTVSDVLDLTQYSDEVLAKTVDSKGGIAGIPVSLTGRTFYWNKATFEKAGLATPTTLDELVAAGAVFKDKLGEDYYPLVIGEYDRMILMTYYLQAKTGEPIINENGNLTVTQDQIKEGLERYKGQSGRMEEFTIKGKLVVFNLAKNPASFNRSISNVLAEKRTKDVVIGINDNDPDGNDVSWLWDVDFEQLRDSSVKSCTTTGIRAKDMTVRLKYCDIPLDTITTSENVRDAIMNAVNGSGERVYIVVNYTLLFSTKKILQELEEEYREGE